MYFDRPALKREAKQILRTARPHSFLVTLLYFLLTSGLSALIGLAVAHPLDLLASLAQQGLTPDRAILITFSDIGPVGLFLHILITVFGLVLSFGYNRWALTASRGEQANISDLIYGFSMVGKVLLLTVLSIGYCLLWALFLFMAGSLLMLVPTLLVPFLSPVITIIPFYILVFLGYALLVTRYLRCSMAPFILLDDPDLSALQALRQSLRIMNTQTSHLFFLYLSFIGWGLLIVPITLLAGLLGLALPLLSTVVTLIGTAALNLWLKAYTTIALCRFYDGLPRQHTTQNSFEL